MRFVRPREVLEMIGVSRTTLWRMVQSGVFPRPVRITVRNNGFVLEAVEEWMKARTAGRAWEPPAKAGVDDSARADRSSAGGFRNPEVMAWPNRRPFV